MKIKLISLAYTDLMQTENQIPGHFYRIISTPYITNKNV